MVISKRVKSSLVLALKIFGILLISILIGIFGYPIGYHVLNTKQAVNFKNTSPIHKGIGAYVINLDRSKERYQYVMPTIKKLGLPVERISGVDGRALPEAELRKKVDLKTFSKLMNREFNKGTAGNSLSHFKVWQTFLDSNFEYAIIFEDDISFKPEKLRSVIDDLTTNTNPLYWDIVNFDIENKGSPLTIKSLKNNQKLAVYLQEVSHTGAYLINRKAAIKLLEKALPIKMPIDTYFTRVWEFDLKFTGVENPRLVFQTHGTSETGSRGIIPQKFNIATLKRNLYRRQSSLIRFFYNLKCYWNSQDIKA